MSGLYDYLRGLISTKKNSGINKDETTGMLTIDIWKSVDPANMKAIFSKIAVPNPYKGTFLDIDSHHPYVKSKENVSLNYPKIPAKDSSTSLFNALFSRVEVSPYPETIEDIDGRKYRTNSEDEMLEWIANEDNPENDYNDLIPEEFRKDINFARKACEASGYIYWALTYEFINDRGCVISLLNSYENFQMFSDIPNELQNDFTIYLEIDADKNLYWLADRVGTGDLTNPLFKEFSETGLSWTRKNMQSFYLNKTLTKELSRKEEQQSRRLKI